MKADLRGMNPDPNIVTPRQRQVLDLITKVYERTGASPTMDEMAAKLKVSKITIFEHVTALRHKGLVSHSRHYARSLRPLDTPATRLAKLVKLKYAGDATVVELADKVLAA